RTSAGTDIPPSPTPRHGFTPRTRVPERRDLPDPRDASRPRLDLLRTPPLRGRAPPLGRRRPAHHRAARTPHPRAPPRRIHLRLLLVQPPARRPAGQALPLSPAR